MLSSSARDYKPGDGVKTKDNQTGTVTEVVGSRYVKVKIDGAGPHDRDMVFIPAHSEIEKLN